MELGVFIFLTALGAIGYWKHNNVMLAILGVACFLGIGVSLSAGDSIYLTHSSSASGNEHDSGGNLTKTASATKTDRDVIISSNEIAIAWIYLLIGIVMAGFFLLKLVTGQYFEARIL